MPSHVPSVVRDRLLEALGRELNLASPRLLDSLTTEKAASMHIAAAHAASPGVRAVGDHGVLDMSDDCDDSDDAPEEHERGERAEP